MTVATYTYGAVLIGSPDQDLDIKGGTISLDSGRAPHVQASLTIGKVDEALYDELDPRLSPRVRITVTTSAPSGTTSRTFDLGVRQRPITYSSGEYGLSLSSDEAILLDISPLADDASQAAETSGRAVVEYVLDAVIPGATLEGSNDFTILGDADAEALIWRAGVTAMEFLQPILEASGFRLVCDEQREWTLRDEGFMHSGSIIIRYLQNLIDADETISLDAGLWKDGVVAVYSWKDTSGVDHREVDSYALSASPVKVVTIERPVAFPGTGFAEYAVRRAQGRGREVSARCIADWRSQAEQWTEILLPDTPTQSGVSESVTFDLNSDEMTVTTRTIDTPDSAWVLIPGGEAWEDSPIGEDWISEAI